MDELRERSRPAGWYCITARRRDIRVDTVLRIRTQPATANDGMRLTMERGRARMTAVAMLDRPARLWLEDGEGGPLPLGEVTIASCSRFEAFARMLGGLQRSNGASDPVGAALLIPALAVTWVCLGMRAAGDLLLAQYQRGTTRSDQFHQRPRVVLRPVPRVPLARVVYSLRPTRQLVAADVGANPGWDATGDDPAFQVGFGEEAAAQPAGWYRFQCRMMHIEGHLVAPCLYPDYGRGQLADDAIMLPDPDADGRIDALVLLKQPVIGLRLDPSARAARFLLGDVELRRLDRVDVLRRMFADAGRAGSAWSAAAQFLRTAWRGGLTVAAQALFERTSGQARARNGYDEWVRRYDTINAQDQPLLERRVQRLASTPLVSVLVPVYDTPEPWLRRCLDSVLVQAYPHWELCIADDASRSERVREILREYEGRDARVRVAYRASNGHISEASNTALAMARGEYIGLLDHDDELRPHALLEMVEAINARPALEFIYSDEDKIDEQGRRFQPNFKPDWNPDLLLSQNYICHFTVMRTALARAMGGFRKGFEGSQDHDLFLRCTRGLSADRIYHVAKILYHWRAVAGSTALERAAKDYASTAGARAVAAYVHRVAPGATVDELPHGHYRVRWPLPHPAPKVSIIVPTRDRVELLRACIESVTGLTSYTNYEIVVVNNRSTDSEALDYLAALRKIERIRVLDYDAPFNYSAINNWAASCCDGELICLLNNDIEVFSGDWLEEMAAQAMRPEVGAVGAMLYYPDNTIQHAGVILGLGGIANHAYVGRPAGDPGYCARAWAAQNLSAVTAACLVVRREVFDAVSGLDERLQVAFNDIDFCLRVREAGYRNLWTPFARLNHHESASRGSDADPVKRERFLGEVQVMEERWGALLEADPAYNPNLSLDGTGFELAFPPRAAPLLSFHA